MDGWVTIGTKLETDKFDSDVNKFEKKLKLLDKERGTVEIDIAANTEQLKILDSEFSRIGKKANELNKKIKPMALEIYSGTMAGKEFPTETYADLIKYQEEYDNLIKKSREIEKEQERVTAQLKRQQKSYDNITLKISEYNQKIQQLNFKKHQSEIEQTQKNLSNMGDSIKKTIKQVGRWALAVFGIRSAYMAVRQAMSTLSQYDDQMATNIEYIRYALANMLKPVVEYIINLFVKLLGYVNAIAKAWFGINLFANAGADDFAKAKENLGGASKQADKLKKSLAGFDEMNIIGDTDTGGGAGGGAQVTVPSFDLENLEDVQIPSWLQWILDNKDDIIAGLFGIAAGIVAIKLGAGGLMALGIGVIVAGIIKLIEDVIKFLKDPTWDNFAAILEDLSLIIVGIGIVLLAVGATGAAVIAAIIAAVVLLVAAVIRNWDTIKDVLGKVGNWINDNIIKPVGTFFKNLWQGIKDGVSSAVQWVKDKFNSIVSFFNNIISSIVNAFKTIGTKVADVIGSAFKTVINGVLGAIENILNNPIRQVNKLLDVINKVPGISINKLSTFSLPRLAKGGIVNMPGRGVPVGGAIAGERGQEGVIPLTDAQQMSLLGEAIGRYITVNLTNINSMNGKVLSRELKTLQSESEFAFNR